MAVAYTDIQALSAEFATLSQATIETALARAARRMNADFWGALYDDGLTYLTAHLLAGQTGGSSGSSGPVSQRTAGPLSVSYSAPAWSPDWFNASNWGREYNALIGLLRYKSAGAI